MDSPKSLWFVEFGNDPSGVFRSVEATIDGEYEGRRSKRRSDDNHHESSVHHRAVQGRRPLRLSNHHLRRRGTTTATEISSTPVRRLLSVSRIVARSEKYGMYMLLDVNTEIYPINRKERFLLALSPSLVLNTKDGPVSIQEQFEYIMYGRLYDITADGLSRSPPEENTCYVRLTELSDKGWKGIK
ncbi:uncharacterized protein LOC131605596 [Vicia villosa]|uniref:uncharacterized protein LOC131605596 n=1 Tax=Vicia villosa TaxID=3911 RepID=UPI00273BB64C|nr:uncharacterized protein LOC131605596 [Vicia villosa]